MRVFLDQKFRNVFSDWIFVNTNLTTTTAFMGSGNQPPCKEWITSSSLILLCVFLLSAQTGCQRIYTWSRRSLRQILSADWRECYGRGRHRRNWKSGWREYDWYVTKTPSSLYAFTWGTPSLSVGPFNLLPTSHVTAPVELPTFHYEEIGCVHNSSLREICHYESL